MDKILRKFLFESEFDHFMWNDSCAVNIPNFVIDLNEDKKILSLVICYRNFETMQIHLSKYMILNSISSQVFIKTVQLSELSPNNLPIVFVFNKTLMTSLIEHMWLVSYLTNSMNHITLIVRFVEFVQWEILI